jgi:hypothetical protein
MSVCISRAALTVLTGDENTESDEELVCGSECSSDLWRSCFCLVLEYEV